jgi:hypothetical protein
MAIKVDVRGSMDRIIADLGRVQREVVEKAAPRALNKVIDQVNTAAAREIRDAGYKLKVGIIKKNLTKTRASPGVLVAKLRASGRPIPLINYGARATAKGVSVDVLNGRKVITGAFIAVKSNGQKAVYVRTGKTHKKVQKNGRAIWSGLPLKELYGPSVPDGLANKAVQEALQRLVEEKFPAILQQQIKYLSK